MSVAPAASKTEPLEGHDVRKSFLFCPTAVHNVVTCRSLPPNAFPSDSHFQPTQSAWYLACVITGRQSNASRSCNFKPHKHDSIPIRGTVSRLFTVPQRLLLKLLLLLDERPALDRHETCEDDADHGAEGPQEYVNGQRVAVEFMVD